MDPSVEPRDMRKLREGQCLNERWVGPVGRTDLCNVSMATMQHGRWSGEARADGTLDELLLHGAMDELFWKLTLMRI